MAIPYTPPPPGFVFPPPPAPPKPLDITPNSATGGYLQPIPPSASGLPPGITPELEDDDLFDLFQQMVVGIIGFDPTLVRPRWQNPAPTQPPVETNWAAVGVTDVEPLGYTGQQRFKIAYDADGNAIGEYMTLSRQWQLTLLVSFYGPKTTYYATLLADGLQINQNLEAIGKFGIKYRRVESVTRTAELVNTQWYGRADTTVSFVRQIDRDYAINSVLKVPVLVQGDTGISSTATITTP